MSEENITEAPEATQATDNTQAEDAKQTEGWFWAEGVPGQGERPDFLPSKYKTVADAAKARGELERKLGAFTGAPETYDLEKIGLDSDQHTLKEITSVAKELNMSQEGLEKFLGRIVSAQEAEGQKSLEDEVKALGDEGDRIMRQYQYFRENNLKAEEAEIVNGWIQSAEDLRVFSAMVKGIYNKPIPTENTMHLGNHHETNEEITAEMIKNLDRYRNDETYRKEIRDRRGWAQEREKR